MTERALSGLRVVDISQGIAGPYAAKLLADAGASVIKVEPPAGDYSRRLGPFPGDIPDPEKSGLYLHLNTSKRSITLDVSVPSGQVVLKKLLANADVFVAGERTSTLKAWALGYDDLKADFPDLVVAQVSPFGATGPYAEYDGNSLTALAMSTIMYNTGEPDREPLATGGEPGEYIAGVQLWIGILATLENRAKRRRRRPRRRVDGRGRRRRRRVQRGDVRVPGRHPPPLLLAPHLRLPQRHHGLRRWLRRRHPRGQRLSVSAPAGHDLADGVAHGKHRARQGPHVPADGRAHGPLARLRSAHAAVPVDARRGRDRVDSRRRCACRSPTFRTPPASSTTSTSPSASSSSASRIRRRASSTLPGAPFKMSETPLQEAPAPARGEATAEVLVEQLGYDKGDLTILSDQGVI